MSLKVEIADTPAKLARGLMYRDHLADDEGMLFIFDRPMPLSFWGKNTFVPLDIAFVTSEGKVAHIGRIHKLSLASTRCEVPCLFAVEANRGYFERAGIHVGDLMVIDKPSDRWEITFQKDAGEGSAEHEDYIKTAQLLPKLHSILPFWPFVKKPKQPEKAVPKPSQPIAPETANPLEPPKVPADTGVPQVADQARQMMGDQQAVEDQQDQQLPQIGLDDITFADDEEAPVPDAQVEFDEQGNPIFPQTEEEQPGEAEMESEEEPIPDASQMSNIEACQEAIDNGYVMWINYMTKPQKRTIGPPRGNVRVLRIVQPHGIIHARTTGNTLVVTWDMTAKDYRAFIIDRIQDKAFTGQKFTKWFAVKQP